MCLGQNFVQVQLLLVRLFDEIPFLSKRGAVKPENATPKSSLGNPLKEAKE